MATAWLDGKWHMDVDSPEYAEYLREHPDAVVVSDDNEPTEVEAQDAADLTKDEIKALLDAAEIEYEAKATKDELLALLADVPPTEGETLA